MVLYSLKRRAEKNLSSDNTGSPSGAIDVFVIKHCEQEGCTKKPMYNLRTERGGRFCGEHKLEGMVNVMRKHCEEEGCTLLPAFNMPTEKSGRFCGKHRLEGMVNVVSKHCIEEGCYKRAMYNLQTEKGGQYCAEHKLENMVDVVNKRCEIEGCLKRAMYNLRTEKRGRFCGDHKLEDMVDVINKRWDADGNLKLLHKSRSSAGSGLDMSTSATQEGTAVIVGTSNLPPSHIFRTSPSSDDSAMEEGETKANAKDEQSNNSATSNSSPAPVRRSKAQQQQQPQHDVSPGASDQASVPAGKKRVAKDSSVGVSSSAPARKRRN